MSDKKSKKIRKLSDWPEHDPAASREAKKYEHPIPSREYILKTISSLSSSGKVDFSALLKALRLQDLRDVEALEKRLNAMQRDAQIVCHKNGTYSLFEDEAFLSGTVQGHADGFGFVLLDSEGDDLFLPDTEMAKVFDGDKVLVKCIERDRRGKKSARIVKVTERKNQKIVGKFYREGNVCFVVPENKRINQDVIVDIEKGLNPCHGDIVIVNIERHPTRSQSAKGKVVELIGQDGDAGIEIDVAIRKFEIPHEWPEEVIEETKHISDEVTSADWAGREDIRHLPLVTIDGEDAKDFDDAVFCEKTAEGFRLIVAIADVSHYVKFDSALDKEAYVRGNSVYFPDFVVPMLPEKLSNGLCSLNPNVDRLCMVCDMQVSQEGVVQSHRFYPSVMHSHARLTYTQVGALIDEPESELAQQTRDFLGELEPHIWNLYELFMSFRRQRQIRGALDLDTVETRILFGANRKIDKIVPQQRNTAHIIIEECMLAANVCSAEYLLEDDSLALFRNHESPSEEKTETLRQFLNRMGLTLYADASNGGSGVTPLDFQHVVEQTREREDRHVIQTMLLRSMRQAMYEAENKGHFGLNYQAYTHFTSPIRRFPDLIIHRAIKAKLNKEDALWNQQTMIAAGEHCSYTERRADEATRDVVQWLKCIYMAEHIGDTFEAVVTGVTQFGLFVEVRDLFVEGLVHISNLNNDYYQYDEVLNRLVGESGKNSYGLGDLMLVRLAAVNIDERKIDFVPEELLKEAPRAKKGRKQKTVSKKKAKTKARGKKAEAKRSVTSRNKASKKKSGSRKVKSKKSKR